MWFNCLKSEWKWSCITNGCVSRCFMIYMFVFFFWIILVKCKNNIQWIQVSVDRFLLYKSHKSGTNRPNLIIFLHSHSVLCHENRSYDF